MGKIITPVLPHDLPENWTDNQYVTPGGTEAGLTEQHGFNYLMKQVNNAQKAINELDEGSAPHSLVYGEANAWQVGDVSSNIREWFNAMGDSQIKNFILNCNIGGDVLEGGRWFITISRLDENFGTVLATKYPGHPSAGGIIIKACSIYSSNLTSWKEVPRIDDVVNRSGDTMTGNLTVSAPVPSIDLKVPNHGNSSFMKNANDTADYGTHVMDTDATGNKVTLTVRGHSANNPEHSLVLSVEPMGGTTSTFEVIHTGNLAQYTGVAQASLEE